MMNYWKSLNTFSIKSRMEFLFLNALCVVAYVQQIIIMQRRVKHHMHSSFTALNCWTSK